MPAHRTEHEDAIVIDYMQGHTISAIARQYGVSRRTVHACLDRSRINRSIHTERQAIQRLCRVGAILSRMVLAYANKQPNTPERAELIDELGRFDAVMEEVKHE